MKRFSKLTALVLACVVTLTLLTACGSDAVAGGVDEAGIVRAMNAARKDAGLGQVQMTDELNKQAEKVYTASNKNSDDKVTINGQTYKVYFVSGVALSSGYMTEDGFKTSFAKGIEDWKKIDFNANPLNISGGCYVGRKDLKYIGVWIGKDSKKQNAYCVVAAFPEGTYPTRPEN